MKISNGAEANVYRSNMLGINCIVKARQKKAYRAALLDNEIREQRTRTEARILALARRQGINTPSLLLVSKYNITMEFIDGKLLSEITNDKYMGDAGIMLGSLHNNNIAHGDFTPANIMLSNDKLWVIDFGLSEITESIESKALDLLLMKRSIKPINFKRFLLSYKKSSKEHKSITAKLKELEMRGRYQNRTLENL